MSIERTSPLTGSETQRRWMQTNAAIIEAAEEGASIGAQEIHTSVDGAGLERVFRCHKNIGRTYHLGSVASEAAMLALDSPFSSHACLPGDTCFRSDTQKIMRCVSNYGASLSDWEVVQTDVQKTAGVVVRPTITRNGNGTVTVGSDGIYALYTDDTPSVIGRFSCAGGTFTLTEGATHYLLARYSSGSASLLWTTDRSQVEGNFRTVIPIETLYLFGGEIHGDSWDEAGHALAEKMLNRLINTSRYVRDEIDGGLALGELTGRVVTISSGSVWRGVEKTQLAAFNSSSSGRLLLHVWNGTSWTVSQVTQYDNTNYQGASGLVALQNTNRYAVNWLFRTGGDDADCVLVLGTGDYTIDQALASGVPSNLPALATRHGFLVGRIIVAKGAASAYRIESAFTTSFQSGSVADHNALSNLQGGTAGGYYHQSYVEWLRNQSPNTANNVAVVGSDGKLLTALMPDIAVVDFLGEVSSQSAMLALVGQKGDWCTRTDLGTNWQVVGNDSSQLSSWRQLTYPQSPVNSVFGETGAVTAKAAHYASFYLGLHAEADSAAQCSGNSSTANVAKFPQFPEDAIDPAYVDISQRISSGIYQGDPDYGVTTAKGWPMNGEWTHLISATHNNKGNYYSMQIAGHFFSQRFFARNTNDSGNTPWVEFVTSGNAGTAIPDSALSIAKTGGLQAELNLRGIARQPIAFGQSSADWTTSEFISFLTANGFFNYQSVSVRGSWSYANNRIISDTGCGRVHLAGALVEVFIGTVNEYMIRVTTAPSSIDGITVAKAIFVYQNHGAEYSPGWFRVSTTTQAGFTGTKTINGVDYTYSNGILLP